MFDLSNEEMDKMIKEALDEKIARDIKENRLLLSGGYKIFSVVNDKNSIMDDDNLYSDNEELHEIDHLVYIIGNACLSYCRSINKDISTNEFFYTEKCYLKYNSQLYEIEEVSGQGTFNRISLVNDMDFKDFIEWEDVIKYYKIIKA